MKFSITNWLTASVHLLASVAEASANANRTPKFHSLPSLREQEKIVNAWTEERKALIPSILRKYGVDAWLVRETHSKK